jgi:hypothetical protein
MVSVFEIELNVMSNSCTSELDANPKSPSALAIFMPEISGDVF